ncbi:hypothetical protein OKW35_003134 [Paraburkholderia sp. MM5477-R1]
MELPDILHNRRAPIAHCGTEADFLSGVTREDIQQTSRALGKNIVRTPLLPHAAPGNDRSIFLKPENLQPRGSFKVRCSLNAVSNLTPTQLSKGVYTASTGNFALGLTQAARARQADVRVYVTKTASQCKIAALRELGAKVVAISFEKCGPSSAVKSRWRKTERSFIRARVAMSSLATQPSGRKFLKIYQTWMQFWCLSAAEDWSWASRWRARVGALSRMCTHARPKLRRRCVPLWQQAALSRCLSTPIPSSRALGFRLYWNQIGHSSTRWWTASLYRRSTQLPIAFVS